MGRRGRLAGGLANGDSSIMTPAWRIKVSCSCLRAWLRQHQNRKRERPWDSQELGHKGHEAHAAGILSLGSPPKDPETSVPSQCPGHQS